MRHYFAYGSNMDPAQMGQRCPHSPAAGTGWLEGWRLTFGGEEHGWDGSLATIVQDPLEQVFVAVYDVTREDEAALDGWEGADLGLYRKTKVRVATLTGEIQQAIGELEFYAGAVPEALDQLHGERRNRIYRMLRLEITPRPDGILDVRGILSDSLRVRYENGGAADDFVPTERYLSLS